MVTFLLVAAVMAAIAAAAVALPLLRDARSRVLAATAALVVIGLSAGLYRVWSTWDWNAPTDAAAANPDVLAMVKKLETKLAEQPNDAQGWLMLGRSYGALNRLDDAIVAYDHAHTLDGKNVEATIGLGEAMSMRAGGEILPPAAQLFEEAVAAAPDNPRALLFSGFAAAVRGDSALARKRWETLKAMNPPPEVVQMLDQRIAELGSGPPGMAPGQPAATAPATAGASATDAGPAARATVNITIAAALKPRLRADVPVFVFAREPGSQGPPLAAKRLTGAAIGTQVQLSASDSMIPGHALASGQRVSITARVSFSGQPTPAAGDLYGELSYDVGKDGVRDLVIDRVAD